MYSLVLMMAMSGSGEIPAMGPRGGCGGCRGGCSGGGYGCSGYSGCCGGGMGCTGGTGVKPGMAPKAEPIAPPKGAAAAAPAPATLVVKLPEDAKLTINNSPTTSTTAERTFVSPPLEPGKNYYYTLQAEVVRDGRKVTASKQVVVRGGEESRVELAMPAASVAAR